MQFYIYTFYIFNDGTAEQNFKQINVLVDLISFIHQSTMQK